jgi:hypothetical protein
MNEWGARTYGEPCRECGYSWATPAAGARDLVAGLPATLSRDLATASGHERLDGLAWSVTAYVAHIGDNLRIWAERVAGVALGGPPVVGAYDENQLAAARRYDALDLLGARWALERAVTDWLMAVAMAPEGLVLEHPERGAITVAEVIGGNAHDATQHAWDIHRILAPGPEMRWGVPAGTPAIQPARRR